MPEIANYYWYLTPRELLNMYARIFSIGKRQAAAKIESLLDLVDLKDSVDTLMKTFSKGMMQKVNFAQALINDPELLILDEPTGGLDPIARIKMRDVIDQLRNEGKTIFFSSHELSEVEMICDEVAIINAGKIIKQGTLESMLTNESADQLIIEIYETSLEKLQESCTKINTLTVIDENSLMLEGKESNTVSEALALLEADSIAVRNIRYGTTTLESLFINLTSKGRADV